jgi:FixJ family two-component response regulator
MQQMRARAGQHRAGGEDPERGKGDRKSPMMPSAADRPQENGNAVFVVDDDIAVLVSLRRLLSTQGFDVQTFDSVAAFSAANLDQACCLVLDIDLNGESGIELRRRLAASGSSLPVIFITGNDNERARKEAHDSGCLAFLTKPFAARALVDAIGMAVAQRQEGLIDQG